MDWWNLMKQSLTVGAQLLWSGRYGCNNGRYGCTIVMSYIEINKAVSQWLLTFNLCVSVTWPLTCAFHIPCTHTPEIIDMHRGMCDNEGNPPDTPPYFYLHQGCRLIRKYPITILGNPHYPHKYSQIRSQFCLDPTVQYCSQAIFVIHSV